MRLSCIKICRTAIFLGGIFMDNILQAFIFIGLPMCLAYFIYRIIDRKGEIAAKLAQKIPILTSHKFAIQIGGVVGFVIIFGLICIFAEIPERIFYIVSGVIVGFINGLSATIMYNDTKQK